MSPSQNTDEVIPTHYASWKHCITVHCGLSLTPELARTRITALENTAGEEAQRFIRCYGEEHYQRVLTWWRQVLDETQE